MSPKAFETARTLNDKVEFGGTFVIAGDGELITRGGLADSIYSPESVYGEEDLPDDWEWVDGFSGQYGYSGPVMHPSEQLAGGMAEHVASNPGVYGLVVVECDHDGCSADPQDIKDGVADCDPDGWGVVRHKGFGG